MKLASIETIASVRPHPNADKLDLVQVLGWQSIVKRGEFKGGDKCVFVVIDTILPDAPWSAFLKKDGPIRLRTVKLRGEFSQGLVLPLSVLPEASQGWHTGSDVGGELGVTKYEKEIPAALSGELAGAFPSFIAPRTDEENGLSYPDIVEATLSHRVLDVTLKLDGSSCTIVVDGGVITHVCSRNQSLKDDGKNGFWFAAKKGQYGDFTGVIQGELMGPGIQGNQLGLKEPTLYVYQIKSGHKWLDFPAMEFNCDRFGLQHVTLLFTGATTFDELKTMADSVSIGDKPAEGIVVRPKDLVSNGMGRPLGFKLINRNYKEA